MSDDLIAPEPPSRLGKFVTGSAAVAILGGSLATVLADGFNAGIVAWVILAIVLIRRTLQAGGPHPQELLREAELLKSISPEDGVPVAPGSSRVEVLERIAAARDVVEEHGRPEWSFMVLTAAPLILVVTAALTAPGFLEMIGLPIWFALLLFGIPTGIAIASTVTAHRHRDRMEAALDRQEAALTALPSEADPPSTSA